MPDHLRIDVDAVDDLATTLDRVATDARLLAGRAAEAQLLGGVLGSPVGRLGFVEETAALVARVLRARAGDAASLLLDPRRAVWFDGTALVGALAGDLDGPLAAYGERRVRDVLALARRAGSDGGPSGRALAAAFEDLTSVEVDRVVRRLSAAELEAVFDRVRAKPADGGLAADERWAFAVYLAERVDRGAWDRLVAAAPELEPSLAKGRRAMARFWTDGSRMHYELRDFLGPLAVRADGDPAVVDGNDTRQGALGDCALAAAVQTLAEARPDAIRRALRRNANGTVTVTFADGGEVVVDPSFVVERRQPDRPILARIVDQNDAGARGEVWGPVVEKAFAIRYGGYEGVDGIHPGEVLQALVGGTYAELRDGEITVDVVADRFERGELLTVATGTRVEVTPPGRDEPLVSPHAYRVVAVDRAAGTATLENPWMPAGSMPMEDVPIEVIARTASSRAGGFLTASRVPSGPAGDEEERGGERERRR